MRKAKSLLKENQSEPLLSQAFEVIFKEVERYVQMITNFKGVQWKAYTRKRNHEIRAQSELVN